MNKNENYSKQKYDRIAGYYDSTFDGRFTAKYKRKILELCDIYDGVKVLDVGCGNGSLISAISKKGNIEAYGIDISPNMIKECRKLYPNIHFEISSGEQLRFESNFFDIITICCTLHHLNSPEKFFEQANRILKPNGTLIIGDPWAPPIIKQFVDYILSPLLRAGDNKIFSHRYLEMLFLSNKFKIEEKFEKGMMQVVKGKKLI